MQVTQTKCVRRSCCFNDLHTYRHPTSDFFPYANLQSTLPLVHIINFSLKVGQRNKKTSQGKLKFITQINNN